MFGTVLGAIPSWHTQRVVNKTTVRPLSSSFVISLPLPKNTPASPPPKCTLLSWAFQAGSLPSTQPLDHSCRHVQFKSIENTHSSMNFPYRLCYMCPNSSYSTPAGDLLQGVFSPLSTPHRPREQGGGVTP